MPVGTHSNEMKIAPADTSFLRTAIGELGQSRMLDGSAGAQAHHRDEVRKHLSGLPIKEVEAFARNALLGMASEQYPWMQRARATMLALLPTVIHATAEGGERISTEKWLELYTEAVGKIPGNFVDRSIPDLIEAGRVLAPVMLRGSEGKADPKRVRIVAEIWSKVPAKFSPSQHLPGVKTAAKNVVAVGVESIILALADKPPVDETTVPQTTQARPEPAPDEVPSTEVDATDANKDQVGALTETVSPPIPTPEPGANEELAGSLPAPQSEPDAPEPPRSTRAPRAKKQAPKKAAAAKRAATRQTESEAETPSTRLRKKREGSEASPRTTRRRKSSEGTTVFEAAPQAGLVLNADGSIKGVDTPVSALELRILYVLGTAKGPLQKDEFLRGVTGKEKLTAYAKDEIGRALVRLRRALTTVPLPHEATADANAYERHIPVPDSADPTYRLNTPIALPEDTEHPQLRPDGYVMPRRKK